jgi:molybdate transport system permease protein
MAQHRFTCFGLCALLLAATTMMVAGNIPGLTQTASLAIYDVVQTGQAPRAGCLAISISLVSISALCIFQRTLPRRGSCR